MLRKPEPHARADARLFTEDEMALGGRPAHGPRSSSRMGTVSQSPLPWTPGPLTPALAQVRAAGQRVPRPGRPGAECAGASLGDAAGCSRLLSRSGPSSFSPPRPAIPQRRQHQSRWLCPQTRGHLPPTPGPPAVCSGTWGRCTSGLAGGSRWEGRLGVHEWAPTGDDWFSRLPAALKGAAVVFSYSS